MQYTGLKDKNGKEIYEGDIICAYDRNGSVVYDELRASYIVHDRWSEVLCHVANACEVIGNIYENPELLKP